MCVSVCVGRGLVWFLFIDMGAWLPLVVWPISSLNQKRKDYILGHEYV